MAFQSTGRTALKIEQLSMLATVVVAFAALAALVLTGQAGIRQDLRAIQTDMQAGQAELRKDMQAGQAELRKDIRAGQAELRKDIRAGQAELRKDIRAGRAELRAGQAELRDDLEALGVRLAVVEHRQDAIETRFAVVEQRTVEWSAASGTSADRSDPSASPAGSPGRTTPFR